MSMFFKHAEGILEYKENGEVVELCTPIDITLTVDAVKKVVDNWCKKAMTPLTPEEIRNDREYWGTMPWHPKGMRHPSLNKRQRRKR